jgi:hypothetical protein
MQADNVRITEQWERDRDWVGVWIETDEPDVNGCRVYKSASACNEEVPRGVLTWGRATIVSEQRGTGAAADIRRLIQLLKRAAAIAEALDAEHHPGSPVEGEAAAAEAGRE